MLNRRAFLAFASCLVATRSALLAQVPAQSTRLNLAEIDRTRILAAAAAASAPTFPPRTSDPQDAPFLAFTLAVPALAAACHIDPANSAPYVACAGAYLRAWMIAPATCLPPHPAYPNFESLLDLAPLAELAVALRFLPLEPDLLASIKAWFRAYLTYLTEDRTALLARDARDHHGSSWLLQVAALARLLADDTLLSEARHRFKSSTLRAEISATGFFPHELTTTNPYRDSLLNLDLLAGACVLLSTRFESVWDYELGDGPGMRVAIARHVPYIRDRAAWPYRADQAHFNLLPCRRPALLFAARAYSQAEYAALWRTGNPDPTDPTILRSFPIRQPILWLSQPRRST